MNIQMTVRSTHLKTIELRIFRALVQRESKYEVVTLMQKIRKMSKLDYPGTSSYKFTAVLEALANKIPAEQFSQFIETL